MKTLVLVSSLVVSAQAFANPLMGGPYGINGGCEIAAGMDAEFTVPVDALYVEQGTLIDGWEMICANLQTGKNVLLTCAENSDEWILTATIVEDVAQGTLAYSDNEGRNVILSRCPTP